MVKTETSKGFQDFSGEEAKRRAEIRKIIQEQFELYGFEPAETPIVEYEEFVKGNNQQDEAVSDIFKLTDKGKRKLALRYELTFPLKRIAKNKKLPYKRYQIGAVFRDEPVSSNRFRQFTQCDADVIGSTIRDEAELIKIAYEIMEKLGIKNNEIKINNRKLLNEILDSIRVKDKNQVLREIDKLDRLPESKVKQALKKLGAEKLITILKKPEAYFKKFPSFKEIEELKKYCKSYNIKVKFAPFIVRGLSYYNGSVFETQAIAGGSYKLNNIQSTGISFGLERIAQLAKVSTQQTKYLIISINQDREAIKLAQSLRKRKIPTQLSFQKISKAMDYANSKNVQKVIFLGAEEVKKKKYKVKDMNSGKESFVSENQL